MPKRKITISVSPDVLESVDLDRRHRAESRSACIERLVQERLRALAWQELTRKATADELEEELAWAESSVEAVDDVLGPEVDR